MDSVVWCRSLALLLLNHDFECRSKSFTFGKPQTSLGLLSLNHDFFAVTNVYFMTGYSVETAACQVEDFGIIALVMDGCLMDVQGLQRCITKRALVGYPLAIQFAVQEVFR